jgi:lipopolysaccharide biosynthesis glycosyltransferase
MQRGDAADPLIVVTGSDENYAIGLAITIRSMLHHLAADRCVEIYVMDGGIEEGTKQSILDAWRDDRATIHWRRPSMLGLQHLKIDGHLNHATYLRLLIPEIVPSGTSKVIYLDSDLLIRRDLGLLWDEPIDNFAVLAGQETGSPYVDAEVVFAGNRKKYSKLGTTRPIRNYQALGMNPRRKTFNAGILVINVDFWRANDIPAKAMQCLVDNEPHVLFCDQYALNVVLANDWRELDTRWNQTASFYSYRNVAESPFDQATFDRLAYDPWICHFTWRYKPWWKGCEEHPYASEFFAHLQQTAWGGVPLPPNPHVLKEASQRRKRRTFKQWLQRRRERLARKIIPIVNFFSSDRSGDRAMEATRPMHDGSERKTA